MGRSGFFKRRSLGVRAFGQGFRAKGHLVGACGDFLGAFHDRDHGRVQLAHRLVEVHPKALVLFGEELIDIDIEIALGHGVQALSEALDHALLILGGLGEDAGLLGAIGVGAVLGLSRLDRRLTEGFQRFGHASHLVPPFGMGRADVKVAAGQLGKDLGHFDDRVDGARLEGFEPSARKVDQGAGGAEDEQSRDS